MGWINNQEVLGKLRQVMNEVLELRAEESARSIELIKQLNALNEKVGSLGNKIDGLTTIVGSLDERQKSHTTMIELLGKKVNEIGKTVDGHFESFVKVSETDSELFELIAQALTGKVMEEEASAEPKLTEKAEKTVSGTDGNGGKERKTVVIRGCIYTSPALGAFFFSDNIKEFLEKNGFKYIPYPMGGFKGLSFRKTMRKGERRKSLLEVEDGFVYDSLLVKDLATRFARPLHCVLRCDSHCCKLSFKK